MNLTSDLELLRNEQGDPLVLNQADHVQKYNASGRVMANMSDIYRAGKEDDRELVASLREDFKHWLVSSTHIAYEKESLQARVIDNWDSTVVQPQERSVHVPVYRGTHLEEVLDTDEGTIYFQVLFNTSDNPQQIKETLQKLSGKNSRNTRVWTPVQENRKEYPERAAGFSYYDDYFHVFGSNFISAGRSRGGGGGVGAAKQHALEVFVPRNYEYPKTKALAVKDPIGTLVSHLTSGEDTLLNQHFRNGMGQYALQGTVLQNARNLLEDAEKVDEKRYDALVEEQRKEFEKTHPKPRFRKRKEEFQKPPKTDSPMTAAARALVKVGEKLEHNVAKLARIPQHVATLEQRMSRLAEEETHILSEAAQLKNNIKEYRAALTSTISLIGDLVWYDTLPSADEQKQMRNRLTQEYGGRMPWEYDVARAQFIGQLRESVGLLGQMEENTLSDARGLEQRLASNQRRRGRNQKSFERFWSLYNPAREAAIKLSTAFTELSEQIEDRALLGDVAELVSSTDMLCNDADSSMDVLEAELSGEVNTALELYALESPDSNTTPDIKLLSPAEEVRE